MRKFAFLLLLLLAAFPGVAQQDDEEEEDWRDRPAPPDQQVVYRTMPPDRAFEISPFVGFRWGGTIDSDQNFVFDDDVEVGSSANFGATLGIPVGDWGFKIELMVNHQSSELELDGGLFEPENQVADIDVTYFHAGLQIPFARTPYVTPYGVTSFGLTNLDPKVTGLDEENKFSFSFGAGVKVPVNRHFGFKFEGRGYFTFLDDDYDDGCGHCDYYYSQDFYQGEVNAGVLFSF